MAGREKRPRPLECWEETENTGAEISGEKRRRIFLFVWISSGDAARVSKGCGAGVAHFGGEGAQRWIANQKARVTLCTTVTLPKLGTLCESIGSPYKLPIMMFQGNGFGDSASNRERLKVNSGLRSESAPVLRDK
jgi:hypothetical protein